MTRIPVEHKIEIVIDKATSFLHERERKLEREPVRAYISILELEGYGGAATAFLTLSQILAIRDAFNKILEGD